MQAFGFGKEVVAERDACGQCKVTRRYGKRIGVVNSGIEGKLDSFNEVEGDGILKATKS